MFVLKIMVGLVSLEITCHEGPDISLRGHQGVAMSEGS